MWKRCWTTCSTRISIPTRWVSRGRQIYLCYRIHLADISEESEERIQQNLVQLAEKADELDNMMIECFGCEFSAYTKQENEA